MPTSSAPRILRLDVAHRDLASATFALMARVFEEGAGQLTDAYLDRLLARQDFLAFAAVVDDQPVGGVTAHILPMTRAQASELFIYDIAVDARHQRRGIGRALIAAIRAAANAVGVDVAFVPADNDDTEALEFYRALRGEPAAVTIFNFDDSAPAQTT